MILLYLLNILLISYVSCNPVEPGKFPWIVSIQRLTHFCAGSILSNHLVLTAASCVRGKQLKKIHIRAGSLKYEKGGQLLDIDDMIINPDYNDGTHVNDVALLVTKEQIEYNENAKPVVLANEDMDETKNTVVAGWQKWGGSKLVPNLRFTKITVFSHDKCTTHFGENFIKDKMLCAGIDKVGKGLCKGDVGGPLIIDGVQYGVVSWGSGCEPPNKPGVYTDIHHVKDWIKEVADKKNLTLDSKEDCQDFECTTIHSSP